MDTNSECINILLILNLGKCHGGAHAVIRWYAEKYPREEFI